MKNFIAVVAIGGLIGLTGCAAPGPSFSPQILSFNYAVKQVPDGTDLIARVEDGRLTFPDLLRANPCNFTADFTESPLRLAPYFEVNGDPGQQGFNVRLLSTDPINLSTTNVATCPVLDEFEISIGKLEEALAIGAQTRSTNGRVWFEGGQMFSTSAFFQASVTSFDSATRRTTGEFRFINRFPTDQNTILIVDGSFALTP